MNSQNKIIQVKPYSLSELALLYGVSRPTMRKWLKPFAEEVGERIGNYYNIVQVKVIFEKLWFPYTVEFSDEGEELRNRMPVQNGKR